MTLYAALFALDGIAFFASLLLAAGLVFSRPRSAAMWVAALILYQAFQKAMREHVYHEPGLTVAALAARLHMPEYRLRRLINRRLCYRNFNHMLHTYRVEDAKRSLADPRKRDLPILSIALSLGYQTINPFNRAFRDLTGTTPSAFLEQALAGANKPAARRGGQSGHGGLTVALRNPKVCSRRSSGRGGDPDRCTNPRRGRRTTAMGELLRQRGADS